MKKPHAPSITPDQARSARRQLGLTQNQVITSSGLSGYKLKQFETGSFNPDAPFLLALSDFYLEKGIDLSPAAPAASASPAPTATSSSLAPLLQRACFYVDGSISGDLLDQCLERMQDIDRRIAALLKKEVRTEFLGSGYHQETVQEHQELFGALGEGYLIIRLLLGNPVVQPPDDASSPPKTHADLLSQFYAKSPIITGEQPEEETHLEEGNQDEEVPQ